MGIPTNSTGDRLPRARQRIVLEPRPESVGEARRVVADVLTQHAAEHAVEVATLLVSEVVTNAVLHAATPIELRCGVDPDGVHVSVRDGSPSMPGRRSYDDGALTGRGLEIVELLADTWGVEPDERGKTVWFRIAGGTVGGGSPADSHATRGRNDDGFSVRLLNTPTALLLATVQYGDSVLRELALTSFADTTAPHRWEAPSVDLGPVLDAVQRTQEAHFDVSVIFPAGAGRAAAERLSLIEEADDMARQGLLLSQPAPPEIRACRHWLLSQIGLQEQGHPPVPWGGQDPDRAS